jgi:Rrf2 family transcriptional regulator, nitric oxide-sensitive transcriptional repressor
MQLLTYTDFALRALIYVGSHPLEPVPASVIARAYDISSDHVAKATKALTRAGLLRATRGAGGGVVLAQEPSEINLGAVVRLFERGRGLVECFGPGASTCRITPSCQLRHALREAESAVYAVLDRYTLADVIENRPQLARLLRIAPPATPALRRAPRKRRSPVAPIATRGHD